MKVNLSKIKKIRKFSEEFKRTIVDSYEKGEYSVGQIKSLYSIAPTQIYSWIYKYSIYNEKGCRIVEMKTSNENKVKELIKRVSELEKIIGQKQINIEYLEKMIELAKSDLKIDIKKNYSTQPSNGSKKTQKK